MTNVAPPNDIEAEAAILGTILLGPKVLVKMLAPPLALRPEHFYNADTYGRLFGAMVGMSERGDGIDAVTMHAECKRLSIDPSYVDYVLANVADVGNWQTYVKSVKGAARRRQLLEASRLLEDAAHDDKPMLIAEAERLLAEHESNASVYTPERQAEDFFAGNLAPVICPWPWWSFNDLTHGGMRAAQVTFVSAWTNHGKSPLVDEVILKAKGHGLKSALYINEMGESERAMRFAAQLTKVGFDRIQENTLEAAERAAVANTLANESIPILNAAGWTAEDVCRDIKRSGWQVCGVDGLHMFEHENEADLSRMIVAFAQCAKQTGCHIVIAGHLNEKRAETAELPPPVLRDIRGSGHIKNAVDFVVFIHRAQTEDGFPLPESRVWLAKGRNSTLGGFRATYNGKRMMFEAMS